MFGLPGHDTTTTLQEPRLKGAGPQGPGPEGPGLQGPGPQGPGLEGPGLAGLVDEPGGAGVVVDPQTGHINPNPHHCLGHLCGQITVPVAKLQPRVQLYIHLNPEDGTADIEGIGTVAIDTVRELLDGKQVKVTPVIDLNHMPAEYQYRPSQRLRDATHLVFPKEAFPFSNRTSRGLDLDHTNAFQKSCRDPQTRLGNFGPFSRRPHRAKTAGYWKCQQPILGKLIWTSPLGFRYLVDKNGTRRLQ